jgi:N-dimethylarginine dimethylaminohydrolase
MNIHRTLDKVSPPRFLMCPPRHFAVSYSINPWMDPQAWAADGSDLYDKAEAQWARLHRAVAATGAVIETLESKPGLPDLVFTANAAVVLDRKVVLARFRHGERQNEEPIFAAAFAALKARGLVYKVLALPDHVRLEGAGDCIWDPWRRQFWMGCGFRSDAAAAPFLEQHFGVRCMALPLADPSFYHLDTAFCALPCGNVIYYPGAFTPAARALIHAQVAPEQRLTLDRADAERFAANAVCVDRTIVLSSCGALLRQSLKKRGYSVVETPLDVFLRSGGSACCLTLRLDHQSRTIGAVPAAEPGDVVSQRVIRPA